MGSPAGPACRRTALVTVVLLVGACGGVPLEEGAPERFDLNGRWVLVADHADAARPGDGGFLAQDFPLLVTKAMRIEQDDNSMGIDYEGGAYRDVTWGERRRGVWKVRAGWHEGSLYIFSEAPDVSAQEVWQLSGDGDELSINVAVRGPSSQQFRRVFRRSLDI